VKGLHRLASPFSSGPAESVAALGTLVRQVSVVSDCNVRPPAVLIEERRT
jgi:hypothetical protein